MNIWHSTVTWLKGDLDDPGGHLSGDVVVLAVVVPRGQSLPPEVQHLYNRF